MGQVEKKTFILLLIAAGLIIGIVKFVLFSPPKSSLSNPYIQQQAQVKEVTLSETTKTYADPNGFTFNYPDNLSLVNNETTDSSTYADIQLLAKGVDGSLNIKIVDSKYPTLNAYFKENKITDTPKEIKLGNLKAQEVKVSNKLLLASLDQGILFTVEVSQGVKSEFWNKVYNKVISDFSFASPTQDNASSSDGSSDVSFEGEEVVE